MLSHRVVDLNNECLEQATLFNDDDNDSLLNEMIETIETEREKFNIVYSRLIRGSHQRKTQWKYFLFLLSIYSAIVVPFWAAYLNPINVNLIIIDSIVDTFFVLDFFLNFFTTYRDKTGTEIFDLKKIAKNYIQKHFIVDILSNFPVDKILLINYNKYLTSIAVFKFLKILRLRRITLLSKSREKIVFRMLQVIISMISIIHIMDCFWYIIINKRKTWVPLQDISKGYTSFYTESLWNQYFLCYYEGIWLIFGQEIVPTSLLEIWVCSISIAIGTVIASYLFGQVLMYKSNSNIKFNRRTKALDEALSVITKLNINDDLRHNILHFITNIYPTLSSQKEFERLCHYISPLLQKEVFEHVYRPILTSNYLFNEDDKLSKFIINRVSYNFYQPEQEIITEGARASNFYFLVKGNCSVHVKTRNGKKVLVRNLDEGSHFGEIALIYRNYRTATVMSSGYTTVANLGKPEFKIVTSAFSYFIDKLKLSIRSYKDPWKHFILSVFQQSDIFNSISLDAFEELFYRLKTLKVEKGEYLFKEKENMKGIYAIANGSFELSMYLNIQNTEKKHLKTDNSFIDTDHQEPGKVVIDISHKIEFKIQAEVVPIMTEETDHDKHDTGLQQLLVIDILTQGTLLYPKMAAIKGNTHKFNCKALESSTVYLLDNEIIKYLIKESSDFKKSLENLKNDEHLEYYNVDGRRDYIRYIWKKCIVKVILKNRNIRLRRKSFLKDMIGKVRAIIACEKSGNEKLAEDVLDGLVPYKYITSEGHLDPALMYSGALPSSHPVMKSFDSVINQQNNDSLLKQLNSLTNEVNLESTQIKACKERISNSIGLIDTLYQEIQQNNNI